MLDLAETVEGMEQIKVDVIPGYAEEKARRLEHEKQRRLSAATLKKTPRGGELKKTPRGITEVDGQKVAAEFRGQVTPRGPAPKLGPPALNAGQPWSPSDHA